MHYVHGRTDVGRDREVNEDHLRIETLADGASVLVVCDGLGGHGGGDVASRLASDVIAARVRESAPGAEPPAKALFDALNEADQAVAGTPGEGGSTAVVALVYGHRAWVGWVGDSRLLHLRGGAVVERTRDHTRVNDLLDQGQITESQAQVHPERHVVTRALGSGDARPDVWDEPIELQAGDALVLISDGVHDLVSDEEIAALIGHLDYRDAAERLVDVSNERGGHDNITAAVLVYGTTTVGGAAPPEVARPVEVRKAETFVDPPDDVRQTVPDVRPVDPERRSVIVWALGALFAFVAGVGVGWLLRGLV